MPVNQVYHGWEGEVKKDGVAVAYCTSVSFEISANRDGIYDLGNRTVQEWKNGNLEITGSIDHIWVDHTFSEDVGTGDVPTEYTLAFTMTHGSSGSARVATLNGVVFTGWSQDIPEDGLITESIDFQAKKVVFT